MSSHLGNAKVAKGSKVHDGQSLPKKEADIFRNILVSGFGGDDEMRLF